MKKWILVVALLLFIPGCLDKKDRMENEGPVINNSPRIPSLTKDDLQKQGDDLTHRIETSQNAIQNNMQSLLGVSVGKLSEDLLKLQLSMSSKIGDIQNSLSASVASGNELRAMLKLQMRVNTELHAELRAMIKANAQLGAQVGWNNEIRNSISEFKQDLKAGRDVNNNTVQFNEQMLEALKSANSTTVETNGFYQKIMMALIGLAGTIVTLIYRKRSKDSERELAATRGRLERAIGMLPPDQFDKSFGK